MAEINVGDVVKLKSGGPRMTIADTKSNPAGVLCAWFDGSEAKSTRFPAEALEPAVRRSKESARPKRPRRKLPLDDVD